MFVFQVAEPQTCPADVASKCADNEEWEGEFFPSIPKIKYEVKQFLPPTLYAFNLGEFLCTGFCT